MLQLSQLQAKSTQKPTGLAAIGSYSVIKILLNKDYLAKDHLRQLYLLCQSKSRSEYRSQMLKGTHLLPSTQLVHDQSHKYEVFPFEKKLRWLGDSDSLKGKPEIYCLALLYSAIKHVLKPFLKLPKAYQLLRCICLENLWFRGTSAFLFLCNRNKEKSTAFKTETRTRKTVNEFEVQQNALTKLGEVFWFAFFGEDNMTQKQSKTTFKELLKLILKGGISLAELQEIMQDKLAKKRFISSLNHRKFTLDYSQRNQSFAQNPNKQTIDENVLSKLDNIPITTAKPYHGLHFNHKKTMNPTPNNRRYPVLDSLFDQDEILPPSFTNSKRRKRFSLFSGSKGYRYGTSSTGRQSETITLSIEGKNQLPIKFSLDVNGNLSKLREHREEKQKTKASQRKRQLRRFFQQVKNNNVKPQNSRFQVLNESSKQKALAVFKKSIVVSQNEDNSIDDKMFVANLRVKHHQYKKSVQTSLIKAYQYQYLQIKNSPPKETTTKRNVGIQTENTNSKNVGIQTENTNSKNVGIQTENINRRTLGIQNQRQVAIQSDQFIKELFHKNKEQQRELRNQRIVQLPREEVIKNQKIFNSALVENQPQPISNVMPKGVITFDDLSILKEQVGAAKKEHSGSEQYLEIDLAEKSIINPKKGNVAIEKKESQQITQQIKQKASLRQESKAYSRQESKVQLIPLNKNKTFEQFQPTKKPSENMKEENQYKLNQLQPKITPNQNLTKATMQQKKVPKEETKSNTLEQEKTKGNFSFAAVKEAKDSQIQEAKSFVVEKKDKKQIEQKAAVEKEVKAQKPIKKQPQAIKNKIVSPLEDDQIEEITLTLDTTKPKNLKNNLNATQKIEQSKEKIQPKPQLTENTVSLPPKSQKLIKVPSVEQMKQKSTNAEVPQKEEKQKSVKPQRLKTGQSNASSNGNKSVKKQIDEYIYIINKMGEAVAKTSKLNKKLQKVQWFTGVYYLYKRFFYQRKKIEKYLQDQDPRLTRNSPFGEDQWAQWLKKGEKEALLTKCQEDNANIQKSIKKMMKKLQSQQLPATILLNAGLYKNMQDSTRIAVEYVVDEYDQLVQQDLLKDPQIYTHICEMINALFVVAEIDGKVKEKRPALDYSNTKRSREQLSKMVQDIFDLYQQE